MEETHFNLSKGIVLKTQKIGLKNTSQIISQMTNDCRYSDYSISVSASSTLILGLNTFYLLVSIINFL